ncbi:MAG TPA: hypothetical protein ENJ46_01890 [Hellea balneolensis]|uniref:Uncharacterized protein n=1 Tax=Hellea balneolensis TaxID=287478 RepID=A0A7C3FXP1_9PROT|nr:hypothetical protein [Hellea balneolensis]
MKKRTVIWGVVGIGIFTLGYTSGSLSLHRQSPENVRKSISDHVESRNQRNSGKIIPNRTQLPIDVKDTKPHASVQSDVQNFVTRFQNDQLNNKAQKQTDENTISTSHIEKRNSAIIKNMIREKVVANQFNLHKVTCMLSAPSCKFFKTLPPPLDFISILKSGEYNIVFPSGVGTRTWPHDHAPQKCQFLKNITQDNPQPDQPNPNTPYSWEKILFWSNLKNDRVVLADSTPFEHGKLRQVISWLEYDRTTCVGKNGGYVSRYGAILMGETPPLASNYVSGDFLKKHADITDPSYTSMWAPPSGFLTVLRIGQEEYVLSLDDRLGVSGAKYPQCGAQYELKISKLGSTDPGWEQYIYRSPAVGGPELTVNGCHQKQ